MNGPDDAEYANALATIHARTPPPPTAAHVAMVRELAERNARQAVPAIDRATDRVLTLPWPETMVLPGKRRVIQVLPTILVRAECLVMSVGLIRCAPEEMEAAKARAYERRLERARLARDEAAGAHGSGEAVTAAERYLAYLETPKGRAWCMRELSLCDVGVAENNSLEGARNLQIEEHSAGPNRMLEDLLPCSAAKFMDPPPSEAIGQSVLRELFAKSPAIEPGICCSLKVHNTGAFPLLLRAASFCRPAQ